MSPNSLGRNPLAMRRLGQTKLPFRNVPYICERALNLTIVVARHEAGYGEFQ